MFERIKRRLSFSFLPEENRDGMRAAMLCQIFGTIGLQAFLGGLVLSYFSSRGLKGSMTMFLLAVPELIIFFSVIFAFWGDRIGKKRLGVAGAVFCAAGFGLIWLSCFLAGGWFTVSVVCGVVVFGIGSMLFGSVWFGLMHPVVPEWFRGRFWGLLRFNWQMVAIIFSLVSSFLLGLNLDFNVFVIIFGGICAGLVLRIYFYRKIPEHERRTASSEKFFVSVREVLATPDFVGFCAYVFLLCLFTRACPYLFGLVAKDVLNLPNAGVVILGTCIMIGSVTGYLFVGSVVDRFGTKPVFLFCHFCFGLTMILFSIHDIIKGGAVMLWLGGLNFVYGLLFAAISVAMTAEMMKVIPAVNKSLSTSMVTTVTRLGGGIAGTVSSGAIAVGMLSERWKFFGVVMSDYDSILLVSGMTVMLLVITLGLIPSVSGRSG